MIIWEKKAITVRSSDETKVLYNTKQYENNKEIINDDNYRQLQRFDQKVH